MTPKNIALLKRLRMRFLRMRHPEHFNMKVIAAKTDCGAALCMIGHVLDLCGYKMRLKASADQNGFLDFDFIKPSGRVLRRDCQAEATKLLGLTGIRNDLFMDYKIKTPKQAAIRIAKLIEEG